MRDKTFAFASNPNYDKYQGEIVSMVYNCFENILETPLLTQEQALFMRINNQPVHYTNPLLKKSENTNYTHLIEITCGVLILQTCN